MSTDAPSGWLTEEELEYVRTDSEYDDAECVVLVDSDRFDSLIAMARAALSHRAALETATQDERKRVLAVLDSKRPYWMAYREIETPGSYPDEAAILKGDTE